jgi:transcriptional regulator with XRE-family HTH domain
MRQTAGPPGAPDPLTVDEDGDGGEPADAPVAADALPKDAAKALRRIMRERGLAQIDLAKRLGVTEPTVSRWLSRRQGMPLSTLQRIGDALEVPLSAILVPGAPTEGDPVGLVRQLTEQQQRWVEWLERATSWRDETADRLQRIEDAQTELRGTQERLRRALRRVPLYQQNHRGDPRLGEGDPNAALPVAYAQLPPGATTRTVGQRGFALLLNNAVVAGLGVRRGDVVYVNPDAAYTAGSLVAIGADWPTGPEGPAPRHGQPRAITLRVLAYGTGERQGALVARTALEPPCPRPTTWPRRPSSCTGRWSSTKG